MNPKYSYEETQSYHLRSYHLRPRRVGSGAPARSGLVKHSSGICAMGDCSGPGYCSCDCNHPAERLTKTRKQRQKLYAQKFEEQYPRSPEKAKTKPCPIWGCTKLGVYSSLNDTYVAACGHSQEIENIVFGGCKHIVESYWRERYNSMTGKVERICTVCHGID